jgi:hypothetical protein
LLFESFQNERTVGSRYLEKKLDSKNCQVLGISKTSKEPLSVMKEPAKMQ